MASVDDLKAVIKETLETRGVLGQLQARIRAEIFNALEDRPIAKPKLSNENLVINELIREYLEYNGYANTLSVFVPETGQPQPPSFDARFLESHLHLPSRSHDTPSQPMLYRAIRKLQGAAAPAAVSGPSGAKAPARTAADDHQRKSSSALVDASLDTGEPRAITFTHY